MGAASSGEGDARPLARPELAVSSGEARSLPGGRGAQRPVDHQLNVFLLAPSKAPLLLIDQRETQHHTLFLVPGQPQGPACWAVETQPSSTEMREGRERSRCPG